jgi:hypothetical protein
MSFAISLTDEQWDLVADLFDPPGRRQPVTAALSRSGRWSRSSTPSRSSAAGGACRSCYEGSAASARAWLEVASVGYLAWRAAS